MNWAGWKHPSFLRFFFVLVVLGLFGMPDNSCWTFWKSIATPSVWEDLESSGSKIICAKHRTNTKERQDNVIIVSCRCKAVYSELLRITNRGILSLVWVEVQDLDFYKYPADSQDHTSSRQAPAKKAFFSFCNKGTRNSEDAQGHPTHNRPTIQTQVFSWQQ